ncbi:hypothetical protein BC941DRAFT_100955 [Chlamydoabsidia padenii]|nr:hypothetical protein BC941DRAFT_100955 [Chlamydoabsidia padenii]
MEIVTFLYAVEIKREWLQHIGEDVHTLWSSNNDFSAIVSLLQERHMVLIVRLCLTANGGKLALVEPVFDGCASISLLPLTSEDEHTLLFVDKTQHMVDTFTPFGTNITDELGSQPTLLHESSNDVASVDIDLTIPPCINVLLEKASSRKKVPLLDKTTPKTCNKPTPVISTRVMPNTLDEFTKAIKDLYLDTLYTTKYSLLDSMTLLLSYIDHISSLAKQINFEMSSVVASLQSMIMLSSDFDDKHRVSIPEMTKSGSNKGSEQEVLCFSNWLAGVRTKYGRNTEHEELSFKALKIKE